MLLVDDPSIGLGPRFIDMVFDILRGTPMPERKLQSYRLPSVETR